MWIRYAFLILCFSVFAAGFYGYRCPGSHERFTTCGDECGRTCRDRDRDRGTDRVCEKRCRVGCFCEDGYIRDSRGECVKPNDCKRHDDSDEQKCGPNEEYRRCRGKCDPTCKDPKPTECKKECKRRGCMCKPGFVRDNNGDCIPKSFCPRRQICGENEKWTNDTVPPATCQHPHCSERLPKYCPLYFTVGGCVCKDGLKRNKHGKCVLPAECRKSKSFDREEKRSRNDRRRGCDESKRRDCDDSDDCNDCGDRYDDDERERSFRDFFGGWGRDRDGSHGYERNDGFSLW